MASGADENWTSRGVYATICRLYRIEPPFYENRRLSQRDFKAIEAEFVSRVGPRELHRRQRQPRKGLPPSERHLQAHTVLDKIHDYTQAHCVGFVTLVPSPQSAGCSLTAYGPRMGRFGRRGLSFATARHPDPPCARHAGSTPAFLAAPAAEGTGRVGGAARHCGRVGTRCPHRSPKQKEPGAPIAPDVAFESAWRPLSQP